MNQKELKIRSFKLPFLPIHILLSGEVARVKKVLSDLFVSHRVTEPLMRENRRYRDQYGPLQS